MLKLHEITRIQIELTSRCNARCPMCMRNYRGLDYNSGYPLTELTLNQIKHILTPEILSHLNLINFNGNLGDFGLAKDAKEIVAYIVEHQVPVSINTNGSMRTPAWWAELADPLVTIGWAIDGLADTHSLYRQDTDWYKIMDNVRAYIGAGGRAVWRFIPFDHNQHQMETCRQMSQDMGFIQFENIDEGRNRGPAYTRTGEFSHWLGTRAPAENPNPPPIEDMLASHITWFDHKTVVNPRDTNPLQLICEHKRQKELYIAADGTVYPCCFMGFYPGQMKHPGNDQLAPLIKENNALEYSLEHCLKWFESIEPTWQIPSIREGRLYHCVNSCAGRGQTVILKS